MTTAIEPVHPETIVPLSPAGAHAQAAASALTRASLLLTPVGIPERPLPPPDVDGAKAAFAEAVLQLEQGLQAATGVPGHAELEASLTEAREGLWHLQTPHISLPVVEVLDHAWKGGEMARKALELFEVGQGTAAPSTGAPATPSEPFRDGGIVPPWLKQRYGNGFPPYLEPVPGAPAPSPAPVTYEHFATDEDVKSLAFQPGSPPLAWTADAHKWLNAAYNALDGGDVAATSAALATVHDRLSYLAAQGDGDSASRTAREVLPRLETAALSAAQAAPDRAATLGTFSEIMDLLEGDLASGDWS